MILWINGNILSILNNLLFILKFYLDFVWLSWRIFLRRNLKITLWNVWNIMMLRRLDIFLWIILVRTYYDILLWNWGFLLWHFRDILLRCIRKEQRWHNLPFLYNLGSLRRDNLRILRRGNSILRLMIIWLI